MPLSDECLVSFDSLQTYCPLVFARACHLARPGPALLARCTCTSKDNDQSGAGRRTRGRTLVPTRGRPGSGMGTLLLWACALPKEAGDRRDQGPCLCSPEPGRGRAPQEALRNTWPGDQKSGHPVTLAFPIAAHSPELAGKAGGLLGLGLAVTIQGPAGTHELSVHCVPCPGGTLETGVPLPSIRGLGPKQSPICTPAYVRLCTLPGPGEGSSPLPSSGGPSAVPQPQPMPRPPCCRHSSHHGAGSRGCSAPPRPATSSLCR